MGIDAVGVLCSCPVTGVLVVLSKNSSVDCMGDCMDEGPGPSVKQGPVCGVILLRES